MNIINKYRLGILFYSVVFLAFGMGLSIGQEFGDKFSHGYWFIGFGFILFVFFIFGGNENEN